MPISIDLPPKDDEIECARCGAYFYYELTRCPECGVNIYEPDDNHENISTKTKHPNGLASKIQNLFRSVSKKPYTAEEVFGNPLEQALLYDDLLRKVGGDEFVVERLIALEKEESPNGTRIVLLKNAIQRWERDNRVSGKSAR